MHGAKWGWAQNRSPSDGVKGKQDRCRRETCHQATITRLAWEELGLLGPPEVAAPEKQLWEVELTSLG